MKNSNMPAKILGSSLRGNNTEISYHFESFKIIIRRKIDLGWNGRATKLEECSVTLVPNTGRSSVQDSPFDEFKLVDVAEQMVMEYGKTLKAEAAKLTDMAEYVDGLLWGSAV